MAQTTGTDGRPGEPRYPPEVEGRLGGRQGGRGPAPGSAWVKYKATEVLGESAAGLFSATPPEYLQKENLDEEKQAAKVENAAKKLGELSWDVKGVLPPDFATIRDEGSSSFRAELSVFMHSQDQSLKEVRVRGPPRQTQKEARKDGCELRQEAFNTAQIDPDLQRVRARASQLEDCEWRHEDLTGADVDESSERRLPEFSTATQAEKFKEQEQSVSSLREWIYAKKDEQVENFTPSGPSWALAAKSLATPRLPGIWYVHERQREDGRHVPYLFFNASSGKYYRAQGETGQWIQTGVPHNPVAYSVTISHGSVCVPAKGGRKDDMAVALPELARTGSLLKQPLPFLDKPAALFLLVDGLRGSNAAAEFCAKRFHTQFLPRLSARPTSWEGHELVAIVNEALVTLDQALLESNARYAGCGLVLALVLGQRLVVCSLGDCRAVLCQPPLQKQRADLKKDSWMARALAGGKGGMTNEIMEVELRRRRRIEAPLDLGSTGASNPGSASASELDLQPTELERVLLRVVRAANPFAVLGLRPADLQGGVATVQHAVRGFEQIGHPSLVDSAKGPMASRALERVLEASIVVERLLGVDVLGTQLLAELYSVMDEECGIPSQQRAAAVLGVEPGCGETAAIAGVDRRYRALIMQLSAASPEHVAQGLKILEELADIAARPAPLWVPEQRSVTVRRALGIRDFKRPRRLLGTEVAAEVFRLDAGLSCLALLTDGARELTEDQLAGIVSLHPARPRAICLRVTEEAAAASPGEAAGAICMFFTVDNENVAATASDATAVSSSAKQPDPKKRKLSDTGGRELAKPARVRISHILLKYAGVAPTDIHARRGAPQNRTQIDAERQLLQVLEAMLKEDVKSRASKFAVLCREKSDCKSALNTPHADLGWVTPGQWGKEFDAAAFELQVGGLSDIIVTPRGVHLLYRMA